MSGISVAELHAHQWIDALFVDTAAEIIDSLAVTLLKILISS